MATSKLQDTREASHADSWYEGDPAALSQELDGYLDQVSAPDDGTPLPIPGAKVVIAPHAGYSYSGPCAAWAYKSLDLSKAKRVFVLGPSHTYYLNACALTCFAKYATPFGDLQVDEQVIQELRNTKQNGELIFKDIPERYDVREHSLEMHLPYLYKRITQTFSSPSEYPTIVPIIIGNISASKEKLFGSVLAPYLKDPENAFVVSSDFCHWGERFSYTAYAPKGETAVLTELKPGSRPPTDPQIHESIKIVDQEAMDAVESGSHDNFTSNLEHTQNTVCGRHPIGVTMAAFEVLAKDSTEKDKYRFTFVRYERSGLVKDATDSSVSYASAYAIA